MWDPLVLGTADYAAEFKPSWRRSTTFRMKSTVCPRPIPNFWDCVFVRVGECVFSFWSGLGVEGWVGGSGALGNAFFDSSRAFNSW